jgi:hypothetical protein
MLNKKIIMCVALISLLLYSCKDDGNGPEPPVVKTEFFYINNQQYYKVIPDKMYILYDTSYDLTNIFDKSQILSKDISFHQVNPFKDNKLIKKYIAVANGTEQQFSQLKENNHIYYYAPMCISPDGLEVPITELVYVMLKNVSDAYLLDSIATAYNVEILGNSNDMPLWYILACNKQSLGNGMEISNIFVESGLFEHCQVELLDMVMQ